MTAGMEPSDPADGHGTDPSEMSAGAETVYGSVDPETTDVDVRALGRGATVGRYVVVDRIGSGGMGVVYSAYDPELDRKIALKLVRARASKDTRHTDAHSRLQREAQAMAKLSHPNVIAVHDVGTFEGQVFIAMEFVDGWTLTAWLRKAKRSWREVLDVFSRAGRGLAAAHAAGLVHRDFKPENVLVGTDGRVRVMDFGLARQAVRAEEQYASPRPEQEALTEAVATDSQATLTKTGAVMGTPAYMAPEQHLGLPVDARSDQFSFCVALLEGLYGERPFRGDTAAVLAFQVTEGQVQEPPKGTGVPSWIRKKALRGLTTDPKDRHESMDALLAELGKDPSAVRRRWLAAGASLAVLVGAFVGLDHLVTQQAEACAGAAEKLAGVWDDDRRTALRRAFSATSLAYAEDTATRVERWLDEYTAAWAKMHEEACEATRRGEQSQILLDLRMACLHDRRAEVDALVGVFAEADSAVVTKAVKAAAGLSSLDRCADTDALMAKVAPPRDEAEATAVTAQREQLARAKALRGAAKYKESLELAQAVLEEARKIAYRPLLAEALLMLASLQDKTGAYEDAEGSAREALWEALAVHHDEVATQAATLLLAIVGWHQGKTEEGLLWKRQAEALVQRTGSDDSALASLHAHAGGLLFGGGKYDEALEQYQLALSIRERLHGDDHPQVAGLLNNLGSVTGTQGNFEEAAKYFARTIEILERTIGPQHPEVAMPLHNLGTIYEQLGELEEARSRHERGLTIRESALGNVHPKVAWSHNSLGTALHRLKRYEEARTHIERSLEIRETTLGPDHRDVGISLHTLGQLHLAQKDYEKALPYEQRALAVWEKALGPKHPYVAMALSSLGAAQLGVGKARLALANLERALPIREAKGPAMELAITRFHLARALWQTRRDRARALELATQARDALAKSGKRGEETLAEVQAWLTERGGRPDPG
jgi:tetratricopeptide (TPR) repeat protein/tRNA A-37 threonylcarbamoyl transferase component Bud32